MPTNRVPSMSAATLLLMLASAAPALALGPQPCDGTDVTPGSFWTTLSGSTQQIAAPSLARSSITLSTMATGDSVDIAFSTPVTSGQGVLRIPGSGGSVTFTNKDAQGPIYALGTTGQSLSCYQSGS